MSFSASFDHKYECPGSVIKDNILEVKTALKKWKDEALASGSNPDALLFYFCGHGGDLKFIFKSCFE